MDTRTTTLGNGLRVLTTRMPHAQSASINIFVGAGSRYEHRRINGVSHYLEHMLFKGTEKRPEAVMISTAIEGAGGRSNAFTSHEVTCYLAKVPYDQIGLAADVVSDMVRHSLLASEEVELERKVVIEEIKRTWDHPAAWAGELAYRAMFGDQPLGWSIAGDEPTVQALSREDLVDYVATWYVPNNLVVSVAGNIDHDQVITLVGDAFQDAEAHDLGSYVPAMSKNGDPSVIVETRPITQANIVMCLQAPGRKDPDRYPLTVMSNLLGSGMSSRLFKEVRERRGLAYSVGCGVNRFLDTGVLATSAGVSPENVGETVQVILGEYEKLVNEPVTEEELIKARDYSVGSFRLGLEDSMSVSRWVGESLITIGEVLDVETVAGKLKATTPEDVQRVAKRLFEDNQVSVALTGPNDETERLAALVGA